MRQRLAIDAVEQHDLSGWREHGARGRDGAVRKADPRVQAAQCRQHVQEKAQRRIHARDVPEIGRSVEEIREAAARDELGYDDEAGGLTFEAARAGEALVFEPGQALDPFTQARLERAELRTEHQPLEHRAFFAIEREYPPAEPIGEA